MKTTVTIIGLELSWDKKYCYYKAEDNKDNPFSWKGSVNEFKIGDEVVVSIEKSRT